ncbi:hypothetical protein GUJ93_ZPchr0011g28770 [Zizania palustris]|uniref:Uncharacterized protein n=1 Tax=Zizania palustris TaxID=103762 RepID=A0A8J5WH90_ZIZPA|nr:hypothetical protein GUJ93_ZPchr0011g28770 [Zizania palustris]
MRRRRRAGVSSGCENDDDHRDVDAASDDDDGHGAPAAGLPYQGSVAATGATTAAHHVSSGLSLGMFFAVLAAVLVLTLMSCVFGRVCTRHAADGPDELYDCGRLVRRWCCGAGGRLARSSGGR